MLLVFCPLFKISLGKPYLKILDLLKKFVANAPMKKIFRFTPLKSNLKYGSENHPERIELRTAKEG